MRVARKRGCCSSTCRTNGRYGSTMDGRSGSACWFHFNSAPHGVGVDVQGLCNRADLPMLGVEIAANLYAGFRVDHPSSPSSWNAWVGIDEAAWPATD